VKGSFNVLFKFCLDSENTEENTQKTSVMIYGPLTLTNSIPGTFCIYICLFVCLFVALEARQLLRLFAPDVLYILP
jgi:hypothetical protein